MPMRRGRCINFGLCNRADSREIIEVPEGGEPVCPECQKALQLEKAGAGPAAGGRSLKLAGIVVAVVVVATGAWFLLRPADRGPGPGPGPASASSQSVLLRMHGSNTIGAQLAPALAEAFLRSKGATDVKTTSRGQDEVAVHGTLPGDSSPKSIEIAAHGSATAFADLKDNKCDIGNASRKINNKEIASLLLLGDMTARAAEHVLGLDGIAVIVNASNPVQQLSKDEIRQIFSGEIKDWQVLRSEPGLINVYARDDNSGTWDTFKTLALGTTPLVATAKRFEDSRELSDRVANDPNGIGFIGLPYVRNARAVAVSNPGARAIFANPLTVATEEYPLTRRLYLYTPPNPQNGMTREFVNFALSPAGQEVVKQNGFVEQSGVHQPVEPSAGASEEYRRVTAGAERFRFNFHFRSGSSTLDNKAWDDLDRLVPRYSGETILLLGFADNQGDPRKNHILSLNRASAVSNELWKRGIKTTQVVGFGAEMPVASNLTPEDREKNRRVEIWVKR
jgi:phosphate transport system substrate-binding protein